MAILCHNYTTGQLLQGDLKSLGSDNYLYSAADGIDKPCYEGNKEIDQILHRHMCQCSLIVQW